MTTRRTRPLLAAAILALAGAHAALAVDSKDNAALRYWRAFALVDADKAEAVNTVGRDALGAAEFTLTDETALGVIRDDDLIDRLIGAADLPECDFAIEYERGIGALLPHLGPMRTGATALLLRARFDIAHGDQAHAAACIAAAIRSAEHIVGDGVLISSLVSASIIERTRPVVDAAVNSGHLNTEQRAVLLGAIERFERDDPFGVVSALRAETRMIAHWAETNLRGDNGAELLAQVSPDGDSKETARILEDLPNQVRLYELAMGKGVDAVEARDKAALDALGAALREGAFGDLARIFIPSLHRTIDTMVRAESNLTAMRDALSR